MNPSDAIEAIEKPLSSLPYSLSRHILEHLRKLTRHEPVIGIMGKSGAGKSSLCNALFQGEVTPVSDVHAGTREVRRFRLSGHGHSMVNRLHYLADRAGIRGLFSDADAYHLDQAFPLLMKQLELMLTSGELNPRHQHTVTLYAKGLTCKADTLSSCGYVYLAVYPTPEMKN
ncbi:type IV toxin-antitoxin system YeeU family antitoxin [Escherichia coli]|nr:type IV toxin-antitoxin system YeeU family antitoxin [Escherichia coli]